MHYKEFIVNLSNSNDSLNQASITFEKNFLQDLGYELSLHENHNLIYEDLL